MFSFNTKIFESESEFLNYGKSLLKELELCKEFVSLDYADIYATAHNCNKFNAIEFSFSLTKHQIDQTSNYVKSLEKSLVDTSTASSLVLMFEPNVRASIGNEDIIDVIETAFLESAPRILGIYFDSRLCENHSKAYLLFCGKTLLEEHVTADYRKSLDDIIDFEDENMLDHLNNYIDHMPDTLESANELIECIRFYDIIELYIAIFGKFRKHLSKDILQSLLSRYNQRFCVPLEEFVDLTAD